MNTEQKGPVLQPDLPIRNVTGWKEEVDPALALGSSLAADPICTAPCKKR